MENQKITPDQLAQRLLMSKKIMDKVDNGDFERGNIDPSSISLTEDFQPVPDSAPKQHKGNHPHNIDKIKGSKLPDAIKQAMIDHPIDNIRLTETLDMNVVGKAKRLMEEEGIRTSSKVKKPDQSVNMTGIEAKLTPIIENIIRRTLDDIVEKKMNQILTAHQTAAINENLVIKVGDHIFSGKITKVKNTK